MTNDGWVRGMARLLSCCQDREMDEAMRSLRSKEYRNQLDHLTDEQFAYAVSLGCREEFLPSIGKLMAWGSEVQARPTSRLALEDEDAAEHRRLDAMTPEERKAEMQRHLPAIRAVLEAHGIFPTSAVASMPPAKG